MRLPVEWRKEPAGEPTKKEKKGNAKREGLLRRLDEGKERNKRREMDMEEWNTVTMMVASGGTIFAISRQLGLMIVSKLISCN